MKWAPEPWSEVSGARHMKIIHSNRIKSSLFLISTSTFNKGSLTIRHTHEGSNRKGGVYLAGCISKRKIKENVLLKIKNCKTKVTNINLASSSPLTTTTPTTKNFNGLLNNSNNQIRPYWVLFRPGPHTIPRGDTRIDT